MGVAVACTSGRNGGTNTVLDRSPKAGGTAARVSDSRGPSSGPRLATVSGSRVSPLGATVTPAADGRVNAGSNVERRARRDGATSAEPTDRVRNGECGGARAFGDRRRYLHRLVRKANSSADVVTRNVSSGRGYCRSAITGRVYYESPRDGRLEVTQRPTLGIIHGKYQCNNQVLPKLYVVTICNITSDEKIGGAAVHASVPMNTDPVPGTPLPSVELFDGSFERSRPEADCWYTIPAFPQGGSNRRCCNHGDDHASVSYGNYVRQVPALSGGSQEDGPKDELRLRRAACESCTRSRTNGGSAA